MTVLWGEPSYAECCNSMMSSVSLRHRAPYAPRLYNVRVTISSAHPNGELAVVHCCSQAHGFCTLFYLYHPGANKGWYSTCKLVATGAITCGHEGAKSGRLPELVERTREGESKRVCYMKRVPCEKLKWLGLKPWEKYPNYILPLCISFWALVVWSMVKKAHWYSLHRSPFQGAQQSAEE